MSMNEVESMIAMRDIKLVKEKIDPYIGSKVRIKANKGRKKIVIREGILESTYPSIFIVKVQNEFQDSYQTLSYSYTDILTNTVELSLCKE